MIEVKEITNMIIVNNVIYNDEEEFIYRFYNEEQAKKFIKEKKKEFIKDNYSITFFEEEFDFTATKNEHEVVFFINL